MPEQEKIKEKMKLGEKDEDLMTEQGREQLMQDDEITELEQGFVEGYMKGSKMTNCATCNKILTDNVIEKEIDSTIYRFCSEQCALKFKKPYRKKFENTE